MGPLSNAAFFTGHYLWGPFVGRVRKAHQSVAAVDPPITLSCFGLGSRVEPGATDAPTQAPLDRLHRSGVLVRARLPGWRFAFVRSRNGEETQGFENPRHMYGLRQSS